MYNITGEVETRKVRINGKLLSPEHSIKVFPHSPDGFAWAYSGSGPAQLALAILLTCTTEEDAVRLHQTFKGDFIARLPNDDFSYGIHIEEWLEDHGAEYVPNELDFKPYTVEESGTRVCDERCSRATSKKCHCSCAGKNHGTELRT